MSDNLINGAWVEARGEAWVSRSPADRSDVLGEFTEDLSAVDEAVDSARRAQPAWEALGVEGRKAHLMAFKRELVARREAIGRTLAREVGKPLWEAMTEADALGSKIDVTFKDSMGYVAGQLMAGSQRLMDGGWETRALGVCAVPGPFNFPLHLAHGHITAALATGNAAIFKPSELAPACAQLYAEAAHAAGLPAGVLSVVQGGAAAGRRLSEHDVDAVLFTGSVKAGIAIRRANLEKPWKLLALEMGGKNTSVVFEDAPLERAAYEIAQAALLTCGQRCTATSRVVVARSMMGPLTQKLAAIWRAVKVGHPLDDSTFMGPLINAAAVERFLAGAQTARAEGLEAVVEGSVATVERDGAALDGYYVRPALWRASHAPTPEDPHGGAELFGPDVVLYEVPDGDEDQAVAYANATHFGLAMSVFTRDEARFARVGRRLQAGVLNFNRSTVGAVAQMPFGGVKMSGNNRPAALLAVSNCVHPVSTLRSPESLEPKDVMARFPVGSLFAGG